MTLALAAAAVLVAAAAAVPSAAVAQPAPSALHLLDVPYVPQSEALCGGAATAMVMRYWGATGVYAETFAGLVRDQAGIRGEDLLAALRTRGWDARSFRGDRVLVGSQLARGRPVIALIEDRPGRFHYVVIVGWAGERVIAHDPATAPFQVFREAEFLEAWKPTGYWTMLALPPGDGEVTRPASAVTNAEAGPDGSPCAGLVNEAVTLAGMGRTADARRALDAAADACPGSPAPWREMAGLHALNEEWEEAAADARRALDRDRGDAHAWRILATSEYVAGRDEAALAAWNEAGEPMLDLIDIKGLARTRYSVAMRALGLEPQTLVTPRALETARRRLAELPAAQATRVRYTPAGNGSAMVGAVVLERPLVPTSPVSLAAIGLRALTDRELRVEIASPTGGGELVAAAWRWWAPRPAVRVAFTAPAPIGGTWGVRAWTEQETFTPAAGGVAERRRGAQVFVSNWTTGAMRWALGAGLERWPDRGSAAAVDVSLERRLASDRVSVVGRLGARAGDVRGWTGSIGGAWRSSTRNEGPVLHAGGGLEGVARGTPMMLWPGAGTGHLREPLLRAHPLLDDGEIGGGVYGRTLVHGGVEWRAWRQLLRWPVRYAPALFADTARAFDQSDGFDRRWHVDVGAGLRLGVPGAGVLRVDLTRGLRDGRTTLSFGWTR